MKVTTTGTYTDGKETITHDNKEIAINHAESEIKWENTISVRLSTGEKFDGDYA